MFSSKINMKIYKFIDGKESEIMEIRTRTTRGGLAPEKYLTEQQQRRLLAYVKAQADIARFRNTTRAIINEMIVMLFLNTGLRARELCDLRLRDLPVTHGKKMIFVRTGKGKTVRIVEISDRFCKRLEQFIELYREKAKPADYLFINERGTPIQYVSIYSKITGIGKRAGVAHLHPHVLRHSYLTRLYNVEHDLRFVQDQAGHKSPVTTAIYAQTDQPARRKQVNAMDNVNLLTE